MVDLAESSTGCECGSDRLESPTNHPGEGSFCICASCGTAYRLEMKATRVDWAVVERELESRPHELYAMRWHRNGAAIERRAFAEVSRRLRGAQRLGRSTRSTAALVLAFLAALALVALKAVHS